MEMELPRPADGDVNRGTAALALSIIFGVFSLVSTVLRLGVRTMTKKLHWDDLAIGIAVLLFMVQIVIGALATHAGFGRHEYYLTLDQIEESLKYNYISEVLLFIIIPCTKISICLFVLRIKNTGWLKWLLYAMIAGLVITAVVPIIILFVQCRPISAFWELGTGECWSPQVLIDVNYFQVAYSILSDILCTLLPIFILWNTQIQPKFKVAICGLMSLGLIATACAIVRMSLFAGNLSADLTWNRCLISIWCLLEEAFGIICANLALSRYIYQFFAESGWSRKSRYYMSGSSERPVLAPTSGAYGTEITQTSTTDKRGSEVSFDNSVRKTTEFSIADARSDGYTSQSNGRPGSHYAWAGERV